MFGATKKILSLALVLASTSSFANSSLLRWTAAEDQDGSVAHIIEVLSKKLSRPLTATDFLLQEDRDLAFNHYKRLVQLVEGIPVHGKAIRIWTELGSNLAIQVEADLAGPKAIDIAILGLRASGGTSSQLRRNLSSEKTMSLIRKSVLTDSDDPYIHAVDWKDEWQDSTLFRIAKVKGKRGYHKIRINLFTRKVVGREYQEFPQADLTIPVQVFQVYEEDEKTHTLLPRVSAELRHILPQVPQISGDIYAPLKTQHYYDTKFDPVLGETDAGRAQGAWSMSYLKQQAANIRNGLPLVDNDFSRGVLLQGRFATINIHPDALTKFAPWAFTPQNSSPFFPNWVDVSVAGTTVQELLPSMALGGKPLFSAQEALDRPARRLPDHNASTYLNDGFDEIQVYYAIDTLFDALQTRGWKDPELSTRPFNAFLFNPDISMRDNAFYTDDTINFTTYSPTAGNAARDNSTIWHELGHGVMDRLMGDNIELADTGGLSEGMADFVAAMVIRAVTQGTAFAGSNDFRIINKTGFNLTNEVHDDGEAYGGTMKDFMDAVIARDGQPGLDKVVDVVLEAMRLTRDFPGLTAPEWFNHILFADSLGRPGLRMPGELKPLLLAALASRNFSMDGSPVATFSLVNASDGQEIAADKPGSRNSPITVKLPSDGSANFTLQASVKSTGAFAFRFPVQIRVKYEGGPLEGAIHWSGEEKGDQVFMLNSETEVATIPLQVTGKCDEVNRADGSCVDYAYVQVWNAGETQRPAAKKRFYLHVKAGL